MGIGHAIARALAAEEASLQLAADLAREQQIRRRVRATADAALITITEVLADEGAPHGTRVHAVNPGPIRTERCDGLVVKRSQAKGASPAMAAVHAGMVGTA